MTAVPRYRPNSGAVILQAGFRPFFLAAAIWAALAVPLWLAAYAEGLILPTALDPVVWHAHEMIYGFAAAVVAGFLLTAIPNWTSRLPLQGTPLALLLLLWAIGRLGVLFAAKLGAPAATAADLCFPAIFLTVVAREIVAGKNWRNLPMVAALALLLAGNLLVHLGALGIADTGSLGNRLGLATLLMLISLVGGRIVPSFTRNWLTKAHPDIAPPARNGHFDLCALIVTGIALLLWVIDPNGTMASWSLIGAGGVSLLRLARWRGARTIAEPLLAILHIGYGWLGVGLLLLGADRLFDVVGASGALHALTVGAIGAMTLAVMTRASLGHTGRPLSAGPGTKAIYVLVTIASVLRILSPFAGGRTELVLWLAGFAWTGAFGLFAILYGRVLTGPRVPDGVAKPI